MFQAFNLVSTLRRANVGLPLRLAGRRPSAREVAALDAVCLAGRGRHRPSELSGAPSHCPHRPLPPSGGAPVRLPAEPFGVVFADGERVPLRVVAVLSARSLPGDLLVPREVVRAHDPSGADRGHPCAGAGGAAGRFRRSGAGRGHLGGGIAFVALKSIRAGLSQQVGAPVSLVVPGPVVGGVVGLCLLLAVVASVVSTRRLPGGPGVA